MRYLLLHGATVYTDSSQEPYRLVAFPDMQEVLRTHSYSNPHGAVTGISNVIINHLKLKE